MIYDIFEDTHINVLNKIDNKSIDKGALIFCGDSLQLITTYYNKSDFLTVYLIIAKDLKESVIR